LPGDNLVIVESPAKAKTINKYLGPDYTVLASYGHVRDLPAKDGSVRPDDGFEMDWELGDRAKRHVDAIAKAARGAARVFLATDPDREGEAISWHISEVLKARRGLPKLEFNRVTFNEVTRRAVEEAFRNPRPLNVELIEAYLARRALDYLVGFTLSPVLWRKLPGSKSAGRVQSVALRLVCEREAEIEGFRPREYWTIEAVLRTPAGAEFTARLTHLDGRKLAKFDLPDEAAAMAAARRLEPLPFRVAKVERREVRRHPWPPFTTSTLQQESSRKLGLGATATMRIAQRLYEGVDIGGETVGLITYMRTDGLTLSAEALEGARAMIGATWGGRYLPAAPRLYKSTAKNAQEAHEAIRPTDFARRPDAVRRHLKGEEARLYELIWKRAVACQMESAVLDQVTVDVASTDDAAVLRATGSIVKFDGFLAVYDEDRDDPADADDAAEEKAGQGRRLPAMAERDPLERVKTLPSRHETQPPPRYTEASLVKRLEELGIGRPSTYASILQVLQDREYVRLEKRRFYAEDRGRLVTAFLAAFFDRYVEYDFTARLEEQLDDISGGRIDWKTVLADFWKAFKAAVDGTQDLTISQVIEQVDRDLGPHFFPPRPDGADPRGCPSCGKGRLGLRFARGGAFIGCSNYPECRYTRPLEVVGPQAEAEAAAFPRPLGEDAAGRQVSVRKGPYGFYVQAGEADGNGGKPQRVSLPKGEDPNALELRRALDMLALPRRVGVHDGQEISAGVGRYGPYLKRGPIYRNLPADEDVLTIGINRAAELMAEAPARPSREPLRELGEHPEGGPVTVFAGRYGPYVRHGRVMASLPKALDVKDLTLERALDLLAAKADRPGGGRGRARRAAKGTAAPAAAARTGKPARRKAGGAGRTSGKGRSPGPAAAD
jgi:DNA topoisomerase-1